jgi:hypothetical protein
MENEQDQADNQQDVDEAGAHVKCEKAKQPENNQNQGDKSEHSFVSSSRGEEFWASCGSPSCDGRCPKVITQGDFKRAREENLCSLGQFRSAEESGWDFLDCHHDGKGYGEDWRMRDFEQTGIANSRMLTSKGNPKEK